MNVFDKWERGVENDVRRAVTGILGAEKLPDCVELVHNLVEALTHDCISSSGERQLPYRYLIVRIGVADDGLRAALAEVLRSRATVTNAIRQSLEELGCVCPRPLRVDALAVNETALDSPQRGYDYYGSLELPPPPTVKVTVKSGIAEHTTYTLQKHTIYIGRDLAVHDKKGSLIRRNDVVFQDSAISRTHARIDFDDEMVRYRLFDDSSRAGSTIFRDNQSLAVPSGSKGGAWLLSGDEIHLGPAQLVIEIAAH